MLEFRKYNNIAGIYKWENKINHKCYIGQSINIGSRLRHHINSYIHKRYNNPLHKAFEKYGIEQFDVEILFSVKNPEKCIKPLLDALEIGFIEMYNSYGSTGYNQTRGGDGGILGYKFTEEQCDHISECSKKCAVAHYKKAYFYNIRTNEKLIFESLTKAAEYFNVSHSSITRVCGWKWLRIKSEWVAAFDEKSLLLQVERAKMKIKANKSRPKQKRLFKTQDGKKIISNEQRQKIRNSLFKYKVEVYDGENLVKIYDNTLESNELFNYKNPNCICSQIRKYQKRGYKYRGKYTFKLIEKY